MESSAVSCIYFALRNILLSITTSPITTRDWFVSSQSVLGGSELLLSLSCVVLEKTDIRPSAEASAPSTSIEHLDNRSRYESSPRVTLVLLYPSPPPKPNKSWSHTASMISALYDIKTSEDWSGIINPRVHPFLLFQSTPLFTHDALEYFPINSNRNPSGQIKVVRRYKTRILK